MEFTTIPYILAVDDEPLNRLLIEDIIEDRYEVVTVASGEQCLQMVKERLPDLILLDINMPDLSGFEVCKQLSQQPETASIPVIFLTAMVGVDEERHGLDVGAVDYITKPFTESILLARIKTHLTLNQARKIIEKNHEVLQSERNQIEQIISSMRKDDRFQQQNISQLVSPVEESNGDIVLSATNDNNHHYVLVGDFTGHGLNAAMAGPLVSSLFYTQSAQNLSAMAILEVINNELYRKLPSQSFLATVFIDWNKNNQTLTIWNFAMPNVVLIHANGEFEEINSMSVALGVLSCEQHTPMPVSVDFKEGDSLFAYSDGIQEVLNADGKQFGDLMLPTIMKDIFAGHLAIEDVAQQIAEFSNGVPIKDDVTLVQLEAAY